MARKQNQQQVHLSTQLDTHMANSHTSLRRTSRRRASIPTYLYLRPTALPILPLSNINLHQLSRNHGQATQSTSWVHPNLGANAAPGKRAGTSEGRRLLLCRCLDYATWKRSDLGREIFLKIEREKRGRREREKGVEYYPSKILGIYIYIFFVPFSYLSATFQLRYTFHCE